MLACGADVASEFRRAVSEADCTELPEGALRDDCLVQTGGCAAVGEGRKRDDCVFRLAERSEDVSLCDEAGAFEEQCRMHLWSASFERWAPKQAPVPGSEPAVRKALIAAGFQENDPRPWSAWYRHALGKHRPIDRMACLEIPETMERESCLATGLALYGDRLNAARDRGLYPCDGGELPDFLLATPDPEIEALRSARTDLCP
jgi:hypothetical protein